MIILLDEYDTPMQEAYLYAYWNDFTSFVRNLFNATFKTNPYLERAHMTEITRVSKESAFSDLNNLNVVTVTSDEYTTAFGFTENEVFDALDEAGLSEEKGLVKSWYDGFVLGLIAELADEYEIHSNRESGFGRYDVMMIPRDWSASKKPAIIMEFKVYDAESEQSLEGTVKVALAQIEEKAYDAELTARGIVSENIRHYGFAFEGKKVLIG